MDLPDAEPRRVSRRAPRREEVRAEGEPLEQRLDRWVSVGRQLVDGVAGGRPGSRSAGRGGEGRSGEGRGGLGRWVENRLDWLLEDDDSWREPWQEPSPGRPADGWGVAAPAAPAQPPRRPLEAISRRGHAAQPGPSQAPADDWPDDESFNVPRWQRSSLTPRPVLLGRQISEASSDASTNGYGSGGGRPLPRSSRRR